MFIFLGIWSIFLSRVQTCWPCQLSDYGIRCSVFNKTQGIIQHEYWVPSAEICKINVEYENKLYGVCVRPGIQSEDQNQFFTFKVRTFWQSEVKISVLALWLRALSSLFHNMGVGGYGRNPLFVRARHVQRCVKKCPHFECVIHRFVLALNAWTNTLYTLVYIVSLL